MASWKKDSSGNWKKSESKKKNYTIVDGKKVEKTEAAKTAPSTSSDTWRKDSVSLEEAAQQSKDVERGVIDVDKGTTTIEAPVQTERISLEEAAQQTQTEQRVLASEAEQKPMEVTGTVATTTKYDPNTGEYVRTTVKDTESTYQNLSTIKAGSNIKSAAQLDPITVRKQETETRTTNIKDTPLGRLNTSRIAAEDLKQEDTTSIRELTTEENASLKKSLLVDQTLTAEDTLQNTTSAKSRELAGAYAQQETKLYEASRLGAIEPAATKYESIVSSLIVAEAKTLDKINVVDRVTGKRINQPVADFILSAGEALALTPVSTARMAASAVRDPLGTARASVEQPVAAIIENPAKGLGSLAGAVVGGVAIAKAAGVGGAKAGKAAEQTYAKHAIERSMEQKAKVITADTITPDVQILKGRTESAPVKLQTVRQEQTVGQIRSPESFQVKNIIESQVSPKRALNRDSFNIRQQTNQNQIAKVDNPETAPNYYKNLAELRKLKDAEVIGYDTKPGVRAQPDIIDVPKTTEPVIDKFAKKREWAKDSGDIRRKTVTKEKMVENELADALVKNEYFFKKNMKKMIEDEKGELRLDVLIKPETRISPRRAISEKLKPATVESRAKAFKNPRSKVKSGIKQRTRPGIIPTFKAEATPAQAARQNIQLTPRQTITQTQVQRQTVSQKQLQTPRQTTSQLQDTVVKEAVKTSSKPTRTTRKGIEFPRRPVVPPMEIAPKKPRSSRKKTSKTKVKKETIKNVYVDPMKALGRKKL